MSNLSPPFTSEQVYPIDQRVHDQLERAIRRLRGTIHSTRVPHTLGDDMQVCRCQFACSGFIAVLDAKLPALITEGRALLVRFNQMVDSGEITGAKALVPAI